MTIYESRWSFNFIGLSKLEYNKIMSSDDNYMSILLEDIRDQNKAVLEAVGQIQKTVGSLATKDELQDVADDIKTIKIAVTETNKDLGLHDIRITALEQAS